jgi:hypothetical protein
LSTMGEVGPNCWNLSPLGWSFPVGGRPSVRPSVFLNSRECLPPGVNEGVNFPPRIQSSPLEYKFLPLDANFTLWMQISPLGCKVHP